MMPQPLPAEPIQAVLHLLRERPVLNEQNVLQIRANIEQTVGIYTAPPDVAVTPVELDGVRAEWLAPPGVRADRVLLYFHGGGYFGGSLNTHRDRTQRLARYAGITALTVDYRLAPEHPYPAAIDDALTAYRWVLARHAPEHVVLGGDSAGGGLAVALLMRAREEGLPLPAGAACFSPWMDLEVTGESATSKAAVDPVLEPEELRAMGRIYMAGGDPRQPWASPLYGDMAGLPPLFVQVGTSEILLDDARQLTAKAHAAGVPVELEEWDAMIHSWHRYAKVLPQAWQAAQTAGAFLRRRVG